MSETLELGEQWSLTMERGSHSVGMPDGYLATFPTGPFRHTLELQTAGNEEAIAAIKAAPAGEELIFVIAGEEVLRGNVAEIGERGGMTVIWLASGSRMSRPRSWDDPDR